MSFLGSVTALFDNTAVSLLALAEAGKLAMGNLSEEVASEILKSAPYSSIETDVNDDGDVETGPFWAGFVEFGTVDQGAQPFAGPASDRILRKAETGEAFIGLEAAL